MASGKVIPRIKCSVITLGSKTVNAGISETFTLPSTYDDKGVIATIPISVGPESWGTSVPAVFSGASVYSVSVRAYVTGAYNPIVLVIYTK